MLILGHRGARRRFPENTVRSLLAAIEDGADGVELDVRMSRDGQLVVRHDDRLAGGGEVSGLTLQALREQEATVPTLDEAMSALDAARRIVVEVKPDRDRTGDLVERVVSHLGGVSSDVVVVSSFDPAIVGAIRRTVPAVSTGLLAGRVDGLAELLGGFHQPEPARSAGAASDRGRGRRGHGRGRLDGQRGRGGRPSAGHGRLRADHRPARRDGAGVSAVDGEHVRRRSHAQAVGQAEIFPVGL